MPAIPLDLCLAPGEVTDPQVRPGGAWVSGIHTTGSGETVRTVLRMWSVDGVRVVDLLEDPTPSTGRATSGGVHTWSHDGGALFVCTKDSGVHEVRLVGDRVHTTAPTACDATRSWSTPSLDAAGRVLWVVADWSELWSFPLDGGGATLVHRADDGFVVDADGPSGRAHTWSRPDMPWTTSRLTDVPAREEISVQQPRSTRDGRTRGHVSDASGFANVVIEPVDGPDPAVGHVGAVLDDHEHAGPTWGPGQRSWCFSPDGTMVAYARNEEGHGSLWLLDRRTGARTRVGRGVHGCLSWEGDVLAAYRTGARTPPEIVVYDMGARSASDPDPVRTRLVAPADPRWYDAVVRAEMVEPSMHTAPTRDGATVPYRLFRAVSPHGGLIVWVHGGPTDQWQVAFRPRHLFWLSRGWSIAVVDYRGTTGWGREFARSLEGRWGELDACDVVAAVEHLHRSHGFVADDTVYMGSSAGGLSVLNALRLAPDLARAAVLAYPVVDLAGILEGDDPFETHFMPRLIGTSDPDSPLVGERSPHLDAGPMATVPLLVFHGDADTAVPLAHSERLRDAVIRMGGECELVVFPGEGHGFRSARNIETEFTRTEQFLHRFLRTRDMVHR